MIKKHTFLVKERMLVKSKLETQNEQILLLRRLHNSTGCLNSTDFLNSHFTDCTIPQFRLVKLVL